MRVGSVCAAAFELAIGAASAQEGLRNEGLSESLPAGFRLGAQSSKGGLRSSEFVPQSQTVEDWSEMITTEVFLGRRLDPAGFLSQVGERWSKACPRSRPDAIQSGQSNGYAVSMLVLKCDRSPATGRTENTLFRAIAGSDSFYVVQYAFRSALDQAAMSRALAFLSSVKVCDTRSPQHPCAAKSGGP